MNECITIVEKHVGLKAIVKVLPDQPGDVPYTCADVSKAFDLLGYGECYHYQIMHVIFLLHTISDLNMASKHFVKR